MLRWQPPAPVLAEELALTQREIERQLGQPMEIGELRSVHRDAPPLVAWLVCLAVPALVFLGPGSTLDHVVSYCLLFLICAAFVVSGWLGRIEVHEHAVVVQPGIRGFRTYVIPFWSIDISRLRVHHNFPAIKARVRPGRNFVTSFYTRTAISLTGLHPDLAGNEQQLQDALPIGTSGCVETPVPRPTLFADGRFPLATWVISTRKPAPLLAALEEALVVSGRTSAEGIARAALGNVVLESAKQPLSDAEIYPPSPYAWFTDESSGSSSDR